MEEYAKCLQDTSGTPAFGQDINGFYTIINIATTIVILSYYTPLNFEFRLPGGLTFDAKVAFARNAKSSPPSPPPEPAP